jgi:hypothetical protein
MRRSGQRVSIDAPSVGMTNNAGRLLLSSCSMGRPLTTVQTAGRTDHRSTRGMQESAGVGAENPQFRCHRWEGLAWEREDRKRTARYHTAQWVESACSSASGSGWCGVLMPQQGDVAEQAVLRSAEASAQAREQEWEHDSCIAAHSRSPRTLPYPCHLRCMCAAYTRRAAGSGHRAPLRSAGRSAQRVAAERATTEAAALQPNT